MEPRISEDPGTPVVQHRRHFEVGECVWSPCVRLGFRRSTIMSVDADRDAYFIASADGADAQEAGGESVKCSDVRPYFPSDVTYQDNAELAHLDEANILENIKCRYREDKIYTYTANVLLAVNPYKSLPGLYSEEQMAMYRGKNQGLLPPHPYAIADLAYRQLEKDRKNQALVISGESGAGKTETAKKTMHYLTSISRTDALQGNRIQDKIVNANPILESFGNATTVMNMNSSRFGKYNEMIFNPVGSLVGAGIKTFLLESSRVVSQQQGEKNYHVFYELLAGMDEDEEIISRLLLDPHGSYKLLHSGGAEPLREESKDKKQLAQQFESLKKALSVFVDEDVQNDIWDVVGALVHLGEVDFVETAAAQVGLREGDALDASPSSTASGPAGFGYPEAQSGPAQEPLVEVSSAAVEALENAADLLGLPSVGIERVLKWKEMRVKHQHGRTSLIKCPRTLSQAMQTLQCIIKILYKRLFDQIVAKINAVSNSQGSKDAHQSESCNNSIGTLDIYGFERLQCNSFEQLCINLANERLQQFFVEEVLEAEQRMYAEESLSIQAMSLPDSTPVVTGVHSIMKMLDEHSLRSVKNLCRSGPRDNKDTKFCEQIHRELIKDPRQNGPIMALKLKGTRSGNGPGLNDGFQICHYAGPVSYSTKGWIDKNNDSLVPEIEALLAEGSKGIVRDMADQQGMDATGERLQSVSSNYWNNLNDLLGTLKKCSVHYIRCFNPNQHRQAGIFDSRYVLDQVVQCGTVELVKIMHNGYPHRCMLKDLRARFSSLLPPAFDRYSNRDFLHAVLLAWDVDPIKWTLGTRRLFLKAGQLRVLENLKDLGSQASKEVIRSICMRFAKKKVRAASIVIGALAYLRKKTRVGKLDRMIKSFVKVVRNYVRIHRWLRKARNSLYGLPLDDRCVAANQLGLNFALRCSDAKWTVAAKLFVTSSPVNIPKYSGRLAQEVQNLQTESVLYFDGSAVKCATLNGNAFLKHSGSSLRPVFSALDTDAMFGLEDVRRVDVLESGQAFPLRTAGPGPEKITCMCQSPGDREVFATSSTQNTIVVWKWLGTKSDDFEKRVIKPEVALEFRRSRQIIQMCFLPNAPTAVAEDGGYCLAVLSTVQGKHALQICIVTCFPGGYHRIDCTNMVYHNSRSDNTEYLNQNGFHISHFDVSHSGSMLILAGRRLLRFFELRLDAGGKTLQLNTIEREDTDALMQSDLDRQGGGDVSSVCAMPPSYGLAPGETPRQVDWTDWVVLGWSSGELNGLLFEDKQGSIALVAKKSGRFKRGNSHTKGVPIRSVAPTFEPTASPSCQSRHVSGMTINPKVLITLGDDGKMLTWCYTPQSGWELSQSEINIRQAIGGTPTPMRSGAAAGVQKDSPNVVAAHSSALVPSVVLIVDEKKRRLIAMNRDSMDPSADSFHCPLTA